MSDQSFNLILTGWFFGTLLLMGIGLSIWGLAGMVGAMALGFVTGILGVIWFA